MKASKILFAHQQNKSLSWTTICFSLVSTCVTNLFYINATMLLASIISQISVVCDISNLLLMCLWCILCHFALYVLRYWELVFRTRLEHYFRRAYAREVLFRIFEGKSDKVLRINKSNFTYYANDLCRDYISVTILNIHNIVSSVVTIIIYLICFRKILPKELVTILILAYLLLSTITQQLKGRIAKSISAYVLKSTSLNTAVNEIIDNRENVYLSGISRNVEKRLYQLTDEIKVNTHAIAKLNTLLDVITSIPNLIIQSVLFLYVQWVISINGSIDLYFVMLAISAGITTCFKTLFDMRTGLEKRKVLLNELENVLSIERVPQLDDSKEINGLSKVKLNSVQYKYNRCINYPDIVFDKSKLMIVQGASGSGKTTLLRLISGLLTPTSGTILFEIGADAVNIRTDNLTMAYMPQSCYIFNSTVRENITLGCAFTDEQINKALKLANAYEFIMTLPNKLDAQIRMEKLSGGERQRIALARALIRNPEMLILDESLAHLDTENCRIIINNLKSIDAIRILASHQSFIKQDEWISYYCLDGDN